MKVHNRMRVLIRLFAVQNLNRKLETLKRIPPNHSLLFNRKLCLPYVFPPVFQQPEVEKQLLRFAIGAHHYVLGNQVGINLEHI